MSPDLQARFHDRRRLIDKALAGYLDEEEGCPAELLQAMRYSLLAPGKRLRPLLVSLAAEVFGGSGDHALPAACAVEMVHAYSLVHDDLPAMDNDDLRRGQPTCHKKFGEATAILVGDALLTLAFQTLSEDIQPPSLAAACCRELARAAGPCGMVGGQMDDLAWEKRGGGTPQILSVIHRRKTGALFRAALRIGGMIGSQQIGSPAAHERVLDLDRFGEAFGLAFQISDDLLDVEGQAEQAGKRVQKDAGRGKLTYPGLLGLEESRKRLRQVCETAREHLAPFGEAGRDLLVLVEFLQERSQ